MHHSSGGRVHKQNLPVGDSVAVQMSGPALVKCGCLLT